MGGFLADKIRSIYQVLDSGSVGQYLLAARFFTGRVLNMEAIAWYFKLLWHTKKGFEVRDMGNHRVLFVFSEVERVLLGEPIYIYIYIYP